MKERIRASLIYGSSELEKHIGWVTWEEIWGILQASEAFRDPENQIEAFFAERRVLPLV